ncbi:MAG TPA: Nif3-like dinuclear metal center hexameric protein [Prolixibacteraceae bacterium]|nr:Nif3-like dinuclear metal center hexameric protein [Prolixibacteraceae bacterium]
MNSSLTFILLIILVALQPAMAQQNTAKAPTARQIIAEMQKNLTCKWNKETVDTFKSGNPDEVVTGVATCMFANMETLEKAVANGCNLIIAHEPTFYNHLDEAMENDPVVQKKKEYIKKHGLIIFRFHDHWHMTEPDGIYVGMVDKLGWKANQTDKSMTYFKFDEQTVGAFAQKLQEKLKGSQLRIVGDPQMRFTNVALSVGAPGSQSHINYMNSQSTELLVAGEGQEWETYQYVLDASMMGMKKAAIFTGHIPSEEAGMEYCAKWMKTFITEVPVVYIENSPAYQAAKN